WSWLGFCLALWIDSPGLFMAASAASAAAAPARIAAAGAPVGASSVCTPLHPQASFTNALARLLAVRRELPNHVGLTADLQVRWGPAWRSGALWADLDGDRLTLIAKWPPLPTGTRVYRVPDGAADSSWRAIAVQAVGGSCRLDLQRENGQRARVWFNRGVQPLRAEDLHGAWRVAAAFYYPPPDGRPLTLLPSAADVRLDPLGVEVLVQVTDIWLDRAPPGIPGR
ncbi:MAG TPA: hypothetical protein VFK80_10640, partial [Limnochordia bacterium]|nr:hypothetical protein [Limnochordia bacterium]